MKIYKHSKLKIGFKTVSENTEGPSAINRPPQYLPKS
jgi:hypothetical protein